MSSVFALPARSKKPRSRGITSMIDFSPEVNLANVTPGQVLRVEGFRCAIGRAADYSLLAC
jgi:phosphosulfolactate synthase (CoM biosynthesis protein A)